MSNMGFVSNSAEAFGGNLNMFGLVDVERIPVVRKEIQKLEQLRFAQQVRMKLIKEIQLLSEVLLDTEIVIGDIIQKLMGIQNFLSMLLTREDQMDRVRKNQAALRQATQRAWALHEAKQQTLLADSMRE